MEIHIKAEPTFEEKVGIPVPGKGAVDVLFTFKHRTKDELQKFLKDTEQLKGAEYVMKLISGWEFTDEFNKKNVEIFLQNYHGAEIAIAVGYAKALSGARLKNS